MTQIVYWSGVANTTRRAVEKHGAIPLHQYNGGRFVLAFPTYGAPRTGGFIPPAVQSFLQDHGDNLAGVIGVGNTTFGSDFCKGATMVAEEYSVPLLLKIDVVPTGPQNSTLKQLTEEE